MDTKGRGGEAPPPNAAAASPSATTATTSKPPQPPMTVQQPPPQTPAPRRRAGGGGNKRKANNFNTSGNSSTSKRLAREKPFLPPHIQNHNGPITRARQSPNKAAAAAAAAAAASGSVSYVSPASASVQQQQTNESASPISGDKVGDSANSAQEVALANEEAQVPLESVIDAEFEAIRSRDPKAHVIPTHAAWFSWTKVHPLEERALPSFFNGKSEKRTAEIYMEIRNSIMRKFHMDPKTQIETKNLSELSIGELDVRQEVMEFLDHWGLINFHPFPASDCSTAESDAAEATKMASLIEKLYKFEAVESRPRVGPKKDLSTQTMLPRLLPESTVADEVRPEGPSVEYHCNSCSADCSRKRYHCQTQADFDLCSECYNNGKFDSGMSPADFILMEPAEVPGVSGGSWTDQETLLLLEALELFGENNWSEVAEHVATKSKAQCILHFIQMPIEDAFLEDKDDFDAGMQGSIDPGSANDGSSATKESVETTEIKVATTNDASPSKESHEIAESKSATNNDSSTVNRSPEITESRSAANTEKSTLSPKVDFSEPKDGSDVKDAQEVSDDHALSALKEAFQAVGSFLGPGESLSFADAGNPVMALAAYLAGLLEADIAAASARSSLKVALEDSPGIQLASRHCFLLEDPPEELKEPPASESADVEMVEGDTQKDENLKEENHQAENQMDLECRDVSKDGSNEKVEDTVLKNTVPLVSPQDEGKANSCLVKESDDVTNKGDDPLSTVKESNASDLPENCEPSTMEKSNGSALPENCQPSTLEKPNDSALPENCQPSTLEKPNDSALPENCEPSTLEKPNDLALPENCEPSTLEKPNDLALPENYQPSNLEKPNDSAWPENCHSSTVNGSNEPTSQSEIMPSAVEKSDDVPSVEEIPKCSEVPNDVDKVSNSVPSEDKDTQTTVAPSSAVETGTNTGEGVPEDVDQKNEKACNLSQTRDDQGVDRVKRAALTALSAAAVKAKLLADQEEDQIRQLATFLIDKQLHKLETKLAFFSEMEGLVMRVREHMERSRQKLYQERTQIIAARLGLPASSSRAVLPTNRVAMSYANSVPKSLPSMNPRKPPF